MKKYLKHLSGIFCILACSILNAQSVTPVNVAEKPLIQIVNNVRSFTQFQVKDFSVTVIDIANPTGSANTPETEEVTSNIYFGISEIDSYPEQRLYCIKNLYAISNIKQDKTIPGEVVVSFSYVDISNIKAPVKKEVKVKLTLESAKVIK